MQRVEPSEVRAGQMVLNIALSQSALQRSVLNTMSSAVDMSWDLVLCGPYPKESVELAELTDGPTARFE